MSIKMPGQFRYLFVCVFLSAFFASCGTNNPAVGATFSTPPITSNSPTPTLDQNQPHRRPTLAQTNPTPTLDQNQPTSTATLDQASPTPTLDQNQPTPTPTLDQATATPTLDQATATPTLDQATPTPTLDQIQPTDTPIPQAQVTPLHLNPGTCTATASGWDCSVTLSTSTTTANWSVASPDLPQDAITYNPLLGVLSADNQYKQTIIISITSAVCQNNTSGSFVFSFPQANMSPVTVPWSCS